MTEARFDTLLIPTVRAVLDDAGLLGKGKILLCAVSGGADSVALLIALQRLATMSDGDPNGVNTSLPAFHLHACHVEHGLRGESSLADEYFVGELCKKLDISLTVINAGLSGNMQDAGAETRARDCRREIFAAQMKDLHADALLVAHHLDDQAETVLMHLLRGAGSGGLCAMQPVAAFAGGLIVRPFLTLPKQQLLDALEAEQLPHREDESNEELLSPRNTLRLSVLPQLTQLFPEASKHIAQIAQVLLVDERCLCAQANALYDAALLSCPPLFALDKEELRAAPEALCRRVLRRWYIEGLLLRELSPDERSLSCADTLALCALLSAEVGKTINLPMGLSAVAGVKHVHLCMQGGKPLVSMQEITPIPLLSSRRRYELAGITLMLAPCKEFQTLPANSRSVILTLECLAQTPVLRLPREGDRIHPLGASGSKPLRRYFTDQKVDPAFRALTPVMAIGARILWLPALCTAEDLRVNHSQSRDFCLRVVNQKAKNTKTINELEE